MPNIIVFCFSYMKRKQRNEQLRNDNTVTTLFVKDLLKNTKSTVQFHVRQEEHFHVKSFRYSISIQPTSLHRKQQI